MWLLIATLTGAAWGAAGDYAVYKDIAGLDAINTTATDITWDDEVSVSGSFSISGSLDIDMEEGGHYLVMYSIPTESTSGTNRSEMQSWIRNVTTATDLTYGRGQGYIRRQNNNFEGYNQGAAILDVSAGDDIRIQMQRTENNTDPVRRRANKSGISVLKLDDKWDYIRTRPTSNQSFSSATFIDLTLATDDEIDSATFSRSGSTITLAKQGHYLIAYNVSFNQSDTTNRGNLETRLTLDGAEIIGTRITGYQRGSQETEDSVAVYAGIIETTTSNQDLKVQIRVEGVSLPSGLRVTAAETAMSIVKLPDDADYIRLHENGGGQDLSTSRTNITWDNTDEEDSASFDHDTTNTERINIESDGDYLFFSSIYSARSGSAGTNRETQFLEWQNSSSAGSDTDGSGVYLYGGHGQYNRGDEDTGGDAYTSGSSGGILMTGLLDSQYVQLTQINEATNDDSTYQGDRMAAQGVNLNTLFIPPGTPFTRQLRYRWRDDTTALNTTGGYLAAEDTEYDGAEDGITYRLRLSVANAGDSAESAARQYELQWADSGGGACSAVSTVSFVGVGNAADAFAISASANIADGQSITGTLLSNPEGYSFTNGEGRDVADTTGSIGPLGGSTGTELEFSITPTASATDGTRYCFRVRDALEGVDLDGYATAPAMTMAEEDTTQLNFIWRDDSTDLNTVGGTLAIEDSNAIGQIDRGVTRRVRIGVANLGNKAEDAARQYELEFGRKVTSCSAISTWTGVGDTADEFQMVDSIHISPDGESATAGLLSLPSGFSRINGEGRDSSDTSGSLGALDDDEMVEIEYAITAGDDAITGETYCFRLYDTVAGSALNSYSTYPELTIDANGTNVLGEFGKVSLTNNSWTTINFNNTYVSPVVVGSARYDVTTNTQREVRVRNKTATQFEMKVDNYAQSLTATTVVDYIVMESGTFGMDTGTGTMLIQAGSESVSGNFCSLDVTTGTPTTVTFSPAFPGAPVVLTTVASENDTDWTTTHIDDGTVFDNEPTATTMRMMLNLSWEDCTTNTHAAENIDYIAFQEGVHGTNNGVDFDTQLGESTVACCSSGVGYPTSFTSAFSTPPEVTVISSLSEKGGNGAWVSTSTGTATTTTTHYGTADEDGPSADRTHADESVALVAFDAESGNILSPNSIFDLTHFRFYENTDAIQPTVALAAENTGGMSIANGDVIRLRTSIQVGGADLSAVEQAFILQYIESTNCAAEPDGAWSNVDLAGGGGIWRGFDNATPADGATISSALISQSDVRASYEESNTSANNPLAANLGDRLEHDWVVQNNNAPSGRNYCFRTILRNGDAMHYSRYPQIRSGGPLRGAIIIVD